jgi:hypothetical protein
MRLTALLISALALASAQTTSRDLCTPPPGGTAPSLPARIMSGQGRVHFPITTSNPKAQEFFEQGVAQMHSFWAVEAERSFLQAAALDPEAPMPQWGIAMAAAGDYRPRFQLMGENTGSRSRPSRAEGAAARAGTAAKKAVELSQEPGKATALERLYIAAIAARRDANEKDPDEAYIRGLRAVVAAYPDEVEAWSYLALHLMQGFTTPDRQPRPGSTEAVAILRDLARKFPDHPGVHHYIIHGFEGSTFAKDAWPSCRRYPELVPNIPHALHMPGHIWAQTGKWDEAEGSFSAAAENELGYIRADQLYSRGHHGHNVHFLATAYSFHGRYDHAVAAARGLLEFKENPREAGQVDNYRTAYRQGLFALLRALVQFEKWDEILDGRTLPVYDKPREQAWRHWAMALAYAARRDAKAARSETDAMDQALRELAQKTKTDVPKPLLVAREELDGHLAYAAGKLDRALSDLDAASRKEVALRYNEPPAYPRPVAEVLGRLALENRRLQLAETAFRRALDQFPESSRAVAGLRETLRREGKPVDAGF